MEPMNPNGIAKRPGLGNKSLIGAGASIMGPARNLEYDNRNQDQ